MLKELKCGEEVDYENYPSLVAMVASLGAVYMLAKKVPKKYFWYTVEYLHCNVKASPWYSMSTKCFTWKGAVDHMRNIGAVIYMYNTRDDVTTSA